MINIGTFYVCLRGSELQKAMDTLECVQFSDLTKKCLEVGLESTYVGRSNIFIIKKYTGESLEELQKFLKKISPFIKYGDGYYFITGIGEVSFDFPIKIII